MVAVVPFDWQAHDTYFVVAHLHYVLFGGMVFPLFAAFYYWMPYVSRHALSERVGRWVFGLDLRRLQRRVLPDAHHRARRHAAARLHLSRGPRLGHAQPGVHRRRFHDRRRRAAVHHRLSRASSAWPRRTTRATSGTRARSNGCRPAYYSIRSIPIVTSREPLWDQPNLAKDVEAGRYYLPGAPTGGRETLITSPIDAKPQWVLQMPYDAWSPFIAAVFTAAFFLLLTVKLVVVSAVCGVDRDRRDRALGVGARPGPVAPAGATSAAASALPVYVTGPSSQSWWAMIMLILVVGVALRAAWFSATSTSGPSRPRSGPRRLRCRRFADPLAAAVLLAVSSGAVAYASRALKRGALRRACAGLAARDTAHDRRERDRRLQRVEDGPRTDRIELRRGRYTR